MESNATQVAEIVRKLLVVPDKLLTAQLALRPLSHLDLVNDPDESIHRIADACDLMHSALADVVGLARTLADLSRIDQRESGQRVGLDIYYRQVP